MHRNPILSLIEVEVDVDVDVDVEVEVEVDESLMDLKFINATHLGLCPLRPTRSPCPPALYPCC